MQEVAKSNGGQVLQTGGPSSPSDIETRTLREDAVARLRARAAQLATESNVSLPVAYGLAEGEDEATARLARSQDHYNNQARVAVDDMTKRECVEIRKENHMQDTTSTTVKDTAWAAIVAGGEAIRKNFPALTVAQANTKFMFETPEGRELVALYRHPDAALTVKRFGEQRAIIEKRRAAGFSTWAEAVDQRAKHIAKRDACDYRQALDRVRVECAPVWGEYLYETGRA